MEWKVKSLREKVSTIKDKNTLFFQGLEKNSQESLKKKKKKMND